MKCTNRNLDKVLAKIAHDLKDGNLKDKRDRELFAERLNELLDDLSGSDFFGTEGQMDPRGDRRG